ncbi:AraC family transcriptional regulator [Fodinicurvata halophila]|uniref:AraC family transcriptional regulator n=1 Tax=Fodinicurvata halophila TaxID=1419723 RepID=A0ABV8UIK8_9PROT
MASAAPGIERLQAHLYGKAYALHRHDTYAIGITLSGVQAFHFRGALWHCLPGQCHILHPDELHDGGAGTEEGFGYRIVYIDPSLIQEACPGEALPFVDTPVVDLARMPDVPIQEVWDMEGTLDELEQNELVAAVARLLALAVPRRKTRSMTLFLPGLDRVREHIASCPAKRHSMAELERLADLDRWTLARQFRAAFGTSPRRFRTQRQLDLVRHRIQAGATLAEAANEAGFADQSHMTRQFKRAYGLTPACWAAALA